MSQQIDQATTTVKTSPHPLPLHGHGIKRFDTAWLAKLISSWYRFRHIVGWSLPTNYGMADTSRTRIVQRHEFYPEAAATWAPMLEQLHDLRFQLMQYRLPELIGTREQCSCLLLHDSARLSQRLSGKMRYTASSSEKFATLELNSYPEDDPEVLTAALNPEHLIYSEAFKLSFIDSLYLSNQQPLRKVFANHERRLVHRPIKALDQADAISVTTANPSDGSLGCSNRATFAASAKRKFLGVWPKNRPPSMRQSDLCDRFEAVKSLSLQSAKLFPN